MKTREKQAPAAQQAPAAPEQAVPDLGSNAAMQEELQPAQAEGPFDSPVLNAALSQAFGKPLGGLSARWADEECADVGASAATSGEDMAFSSPISEELGDAESMAVVAEETAHALAGGGSGETVLDAADDPGEARAKEAGARFASWAAGGMKGEAPSLEPAHGGRAETHRHAIATLSGRPMLRVGSRGSSVRICQQLLNAHGARVGTDGIFGPQTERAVRSFQRSKGLAADGIVGPQTARALNRTAASAPSSSPSPSAGAGAAALTGRPTLKRGAKGPVVRTLQTELTEAGFRCTVDGDFGPRTEAQVRSYQRSRGLLADGLVGPRTAAALNNNRPASAAPAPEGPAKARDFDPGNRLAHSGMAPATRRLAIATAEQLTAAGYQPYIVSGVRTFNEQDALYAKGRTKPGPKVTGVRGGGSWHNYGLAVDFAFWNDRRTGPSWSGHHPWHLVGRFGLAAGFTRWGGSWGDRPHLELHPNYQGSAYNMVSIRRSSGSAGVWNRVGAK